MFSPEILAQFTERLQANGARKAAEMGALIDSKFSSVDRNIAASFNVRLTWSLLAPESNRGFFALSSEGRDWATSTLRPPRSRVSHRRRHRDGRTFFDTWTKSDKSGQTMFVEDILGLTRR